MGATQNVAPAIVLNGLVSITSTAKQGKTLNRFDLTMDREGESMTRVFELPETRTKVVSGLKMFCDTHFRFVEELRNVVLIFYRHEGCYEEVAVKRLGWKKDGSFESARVGCGHYHRHLRVKAPCCSEWVYCEQCHDEQHPDHQMNPKAVNEIQCLICSTRQTLIGPEEQASSTRTHGIRCSNPSCARRFAIVSCPECRIWRDHVSPGGLQHCQRCGHCYSQAYFPLHEQVCNGRSA